MSPIGFTRLGETFSRPLTDATPNELGIVLSHVLVRLKREFGIQPDQKQMAMDSIIADLEEIAQQCQRVKTI